ncbi:uncharacterized protein RHO25_004355 [Cercospora beticola]|uniref:Glyceraldehyde 3-phosphate dehydrogenase NAD(P) binding domain-containing protein n=1 Tax=Cercospora beticola TaxID=122368 RepID=A0ABZ0NJL2_CERBT|nr:hypothetical protein RHO25_004355 [Cercospora beticola]
MKQSFQLPPLKPSVSCKIALDNIDLTFRIGIDGTGELGLMILQDSLRRKYIDVAAINDPSVDARDIAALLRQWSPELKDIEVRQSDVGENQISFLHNDRKRTIFLFNEKFNDPVPWSKAGVLHVVACQKDSTTKVDTSAHIHADGAKKVLVVAKDTHLPVFASYSTVYPYKARVRAFTIAKSQPGLRDILASMHICSRDVLGEAKRVLDLLTERQLAEGISWKIQFEDYLNLFLSEEVLEADQSVRGGYEGIVNFAERSELFAFVPPKGSRYREQ